MKFKKDSKTNAELVIAHAVAGPDCTNDNASDIYRDNKTQTNMYIYPKPITYTYPNGNHCSAKPTATLTDKPHNTAMADVEKPRRYTRGVITQDAAAKMCGVSTRTIQNWEKGERTPEGYPGRSYKNSFLIWLHGYHSNKRLLTEARSKNRARSVNPATLDFMADDTGQD